MTGLFQPGPVLAAMLRHKTGPLLVALQVALSLAILCNAMLMISERLSMAARPSGIADEQDVFYVHVSNQKIDGHEAQLAMQKQEEQIMLAVPGVEGVARTNSVPMSQSGWYNSLSQTGEPESATVTAAAFMSPGSLISVWKLKLTEGRDFLPEEVMEADSKAMNSLPGVGVVTRALAKRLYPNDSSYVGKYFYNGRGSGADRIRIVGVVDHIQSPNANAGPDDGLGFILPIRATQDPYSGYTVRARAGQADRVMRDVTAALRKASVTPLKVDMRSVPQIRADRYRNDYGMSWMLIAVCGLLFLVTATGIIGMCSLWVSQRTRQIGIRRALGARRIDILAYFLTENFMITTAGIAAGILLALGLNQVLIRTFEMAALPPQYLLLTPLVFWLLGLLSAAAPSWRAACVAPATATRTV